MTRLLRALRDFVRREWMLSFTLLLFAYTVVVVLGHRFGPFTIAHTDMVRQGGPDIVSDGSCFDGQRLTPTERPALDAAVLLYSHFPGEDGAESGSGTVIHDSHDAAGHNRVLTVRHVLEKATRTHGVVDVFDRFGNFLGQGVQDPATVLSDASLAQEPEAAVRGHKGDGGVLLDMVHASRGYDRIRGLDIAPALYQGIMTGWFSDPAALMPGSSGSALLDPNNRIIGVVEGIETLTSVFRTQLMAHDMHAFVELHHRHADDGQVYSFYHGAQAYFMPVSGPGVLDVLQLHPAVAPPEQTYDVHVIGFPKMACVIYHGRVYPRDSRPPLLAIARVWHLLSGL